MGRGQRDCVLTGWPNLSEKMRPRAGRNRIDPLFDLFQAGIGGAQPVDDEPRDIRKQRFLDLSFFGQARQAAPP